jgi:hypothetical protein
VCVVGVLIQAGKDERKRATPQPGEVASTPRGHGSKPTSGAPRIKGIITVELAGFRQIYDALQVFVPLPQEPFHVIFGVYCNQYAAERQDLARVR